MDLGSINLVELAAGFSTIVGACGFLMRYITRDVKRDIDETGKDLGDVKHSLKNQTTRITALEMIRTSDIERIVKLETNLTNLERGQERIEHALEKMEREGKEDRAEIIDSLRELRSVSPKS